ncbi:glycoside hydrolase, partial [Metschnikowia bicuspidata]
AARDTISKCISLYKEPEPPAHARCLAEKYSLGPVAAATDKSQSVTRCRPLIFENGRLVAPDGRAIVLKGINVDAAMKLPATPSMPLYCGDATTANDLFFDGDHVLFIGRPFPLDEAESHLRRIKLWGFNTIRLLLTWEAIEHAGPGVYDEEFVKYTLAVLRIVHRVGGLYVFFDCHQDVWLRFCGGSGAPMWTLYAAGMHPARVCVSGAAVLHNDPQYGATGRGEDRYSKMLWTSNYKRLALFTMFTLFFAGEAYFPDLKLNGQNIQHYLQLYHLNALKYVWQKVLQQLPEMVDDGTILGFELLNEPNQGLVGHPDLGRIPDTQHLRVGTTPTVFECFKMGMGMPAEVNVYKFTVTGPQKCGHQVIDPAGARVWLSEEEMQQCDLRYGWNRSGWVPSECIYAHADIWKWDAKLLAKLDGKLLAERLALAFHSCELKKPQFFTENPKRFKHMLCPYQKNIGDTVDTNFFVNVCFVEFYVKFKNMVRAVEPRAFVMIQPPVLVLPPQLKGDPRKIIDDKTIYCPHYYDGMSLMFKSWNSWFNVDTLGIMRDRYANPMLGLVLGETAIRKCLKKQFCDISDEGKQYLGDIPVLMSETGMPFDMDNKRAYRNERYRSQTAAIDALANALEGSDMHHTYWCYASINSHKRGDHWNNEDFLFWSADDRDVATLCDLDDASSDLRDPFSAPRSRTSSSPSVSSFRSYTWSSALAKNRLVRLKMRLLRSVFLVPELSETEGTESDASTSSSCTAMESNSSSFMWSRRRRMRPHKSCYASFDGVRAVSAIVRPYMMASAGTRSNSFFSWEKPVFSLSLTFDAAQYAVAQSTPTVIFLPKWHFPHLTYSDVDVTGGYFEYDAENEQLHWYLWLAETGACEHSIVIRGYRGAVAEGPRSSSLRVTRR